jgi:tRNA 2-thiouridine synthesizing protein D
VVDEEDQKQKVLSIMLFSSPYGSQDADHLCRIAEKALDKGYGIEIFLYGDGVHAQLEGQAPKMFLNIGEKITALKERGAVIKSCVRCSQARGYVEGEFDDDRDMYPSSKTIDGIKIYSLYGFINMIKNADKLITLGSS